MKVKSIELVFENCEVLTIPISDVMLFKVLDEKASYTRTVSGMTKSTTIDGFALALRGDKPCETNYMEYETTSKRMGECDITHITVMYENGTDDSYTVNWPDTGQNEMSHKYQKLKHTAKGNIIMTSTLKNVLLIDEDYIDYIADVF